MRKRAPLFNQRVRIALPLLSRAYLNGSVA
jgi:hypothetical protein